jgi:hypothetical protein
MILQVLASGSNHSRLQISKVKVHNTRIGNFLGQFSLPKLLCGNANAVTENGSIPLGNQQLESQFPLAMV